MKGILNILLVCLIAVVLIVPIGIGAWTALSDSNDGVGDSSQNEEVNVGVSLSETEIGCNIGAIKTLTATTATESDSYIFQWNSSDKNVATVRRDAESDKSCVITAIGEGTAVITVNVIDKSKFKIVDSATCTVTVVDSNIQFSASEVVISLDKGNTATITAKAPDNGEITWSSEDESIATVEGGVITAHKTGSVYIVAKSGSVEGRILVKVYGSVFTLEETKGIAVGESASIAVDGTIAEGSVWTSSDDRIATVDQNGVVTGVKSGMVTIKVTSSVDDLSATCVVIVKSGNAEVFELASGKKADAAANFGNWYYLLESPLVTTDGIPSMDNGVITANITYVGTSGANFFYLRYQPDDVGDVIYKVTLYIYSETDNAHIQINGKDTYCVAGLNRVEGEFTSSAPTDINPYQLKFRSTGLFYVIPVFEEISRVEKMVLSEANHTLNTTTNNRFTLTATVPGTDTPEIEWVSSNDKVATVEGGVVTAVGEGTSIITAICGNFSATCIVVVEGETTVDGVELKSGNKSAASNSPGEWFYLTDGKSKVLSTPVLDEDGNIHMNIINIDTDAKKYVYLRYMPEVEGTYKVTVTIDFGGADGSTVDITGGNVTSAVTQTLKNGENTFEFEFTTASGSPFQMKFFAVGGYVVNVSFSEV